MFFIQAIKCKKRSRLTTKRRLSSDHFVNKHIYLKSVIYFTKVNVSVLKHSVLPVFCQTVIVGSSNVLLFPHSQKGSTFTILPNNIYLCGLKTNFTKCFTIKNSN